MDQQQKYLTYIGGAVFLVVIIGGALLYALLVYQNRTVPPALLFVLGASLNGIASLLLGKGYLKASNGLTETAQSNNEYLQAIAGKLEKMDEEGTAGSHVAIEVLGEQLQEQNRQARQHRKALVARLASLETKLSEIDGGKA